jgi:type II secretory pathway pseudopilin PulG
LNYIKSNPKIAQRGTTLVELSVVIAVILLLVGVLFIGVSAWKDAANRAACLVNQATIQKAIRGYANFNSLNNGDAVTAKGADLTAGANPFFNTLPVCPAAPAATADYTYLGTVPTQGQLFASCNTAGHLKAAGPAQANW